MDLVSSGNTYIVSRVFHDCELANPNLLRRSVLGARTDIIVLVRLRLVVFIHDGSEFDYHSYIRVAGLTATAVHLLGEVQDGAIVLKQT